MSDFSLSGFIGTWLPKLETEMRTVLSSDECALSGFHGMIHYHMGWVDQSFQPTSSPAGKRLRPMLCLLACAEFCGDPTPALPAAAAIEILHNFSLVHDDVEDGDETRRFRPTVWKVWGVPHAINVGDGMFAMAYAAIQELGRRGVDPRLALRALDIFTRTNIRLTEGQFLDMSFEERRDVTVEEYLRMIQGKTAALIGAGIAIGALIGGATPQQQTALQQFGQEMGLAFQIRDDVLGIWGDPAVTGKAAGNDVLRGKKSLPLLYTRNHALVGEQLRVVMDNNMTMAHLPFAMELLDQAGARDYAEQALVEHHRTALAALAEVLGDRISSSPLAALANSLLNRTS